MKRYSQMLFFRTALFAFAIALCSASLYAQNAGATDENEAEQQPPPLLREGSTLVDAEGVLQRRPSDGGWVFLPHRTSDDAPQYELVMLPSSRLGEMQRIVESLDAATPVFRVTGQVFVFENLNYLLPTYAPQLVRRSTPAEETMATPIDEDDDSVEAIKARLARDVGPAARTTSNLPYDPNEVGSSALAADLVREGTELHDRRGRLVRNERGAWTFIFDADASGMSDPPMTVLPCMILSRMRDYAQRRGPTAPMLVTGRVLTYQGRNYLLPDVFRIPRERTQLSR